MIQPASHDRAGQHQDHLEWKQQHTLWLEESELWQSQEEGILEEIKTVQKLLEASVAALAAHRKTIQDQAQTAKEHEKILADKEMFQMDELHDTATRHQEHGRKQAGLCDAHERIKDHHHHLLAKLDHLQERLKEFC